MPGAVDARTVVAREHRTRLLPPGGGVERVGAGGEGLGPDRVVGLAGVAGGVREVEAAGRVVERCGALAHLGAVAVRGEEDAAAGEGPGVGHRGDEELVADAVVALAAPGEVQLAVVPEGLAVDGPAVVAGVGDLGLEVVRAERVVALGLQHVHAVGGVVAVAGGVVEVPAAAVPEESGGPDLLVAGRVAVAPDLVRGGGEEGRDGAGLPHADGVALGGGDVVVALVGDEGGVGAGVDGVAELAGGGGGFGRRGGGSRVGRGAFSGGRGAVGRRGPVGGCRAEAGHHGDREQRRGQGRPAPAAESAYGLGHGAYLPCDACGGGAREGVTRFVAEISTLYNPSRRPRPRRTQMP